MTKLKFLDLFSGIGGFRLGMEQAGNECVGYCEIDKFARKSYQAIHDTKDEWTATDINQVTDEDWRKLNETKGPINVICGGFPCQSFSIAGKQRGFADKTRGTLFFQIARAAQQIQPQYLFLENVKGLLSHGGGSTYATILTTLDELGYDVEWNVCHSENFGVPQHRERVFIIGHLRGTRTREVFYPNRESQPNSSTALKVASKGLYPYSSAYVYDVQGKAPTLTATDYKHPIKIKYAYNARAHGNYGTRDVLHIDGLSKALETMGGGNRQPKVAIPVLSPDRVKKRQNGRRFKENGDPAFTLTAQDRHGVVTKVIGSTQKNASVTDGRISPTLTSAMGKGGGHVPMPVYNNYRIRKLTPRECWRLQGFPDEAFNKASQVVSNSQLYKQAGNSVTVPVIKWIADKLELNPTQNEWLKGIENEQD